MPGHEPGITRQALYHHFRSKEDVLTSSYEELTPQVAAVVEQLEAHPRRRELAFERTVALFDGPFANVLVCTYLNEHALRGSSAATELLGRLNELAERLAPRSGPSGAMRGLLALDALTLAVAPARVRGTRRQRARVAKDLAHSLLFDDPPRSAPAQGRAPQTSDS